MTETSYFPDRSADAGGVRRAAEDLRDDLAARTRDVAGAVAESAGRAREQTRHWVDQGARKARAAVDTLRDEAHAVGDRTVGYVRDEPMKSVLVAALAGAAIAAVLMALRHRRH
jgi:ElaB/YqjD/DUF883 family membrane-anchored ribosome-binding protein